LKILLKTPKPRDQKDYNKQANQQKKQVFESDLKISLHFTSKPKDIFWKNTAPQILFR